MSATTTVEIDTHGAPGKLATIPGFLRAHALVVLTAMLTGLMAAEANAAVLQSTVLNKNTQRFLVSTRHTNGSPVS